MKKVFYQLIFGLILILALMQTGIQPALAGCDPGVTCPAGGERDYRNWFNCHWNLQTGICVDGWDTQQGTCEDNSDSCGFNYYNQVDVCNRNACTFTTKTEFYDCCPGGPGGGTCGDGTCDSGETCSNCESDCGVCCTDNQPVMDVKIDGGDGPVSRAEPTDYTVTWSRTGGDVGDSCNVTENGVEFSTTESGSQSYLEKWVGDYVYSASCTNCDGTGTDTATINVSGSGLIQGRRVNGQCLNTDLFPGNPTVSPGPVPLVINDFYHNNNGIWDLDGESYSTGVGGVNMGETYTVSVDEPVGYKAYYSICENCTNHPDDSYALGNTVSVIVPLNYAVGFTFAYVDLYWKYVPETVILSGRVVKDPSSEADMLYCGGLCGLPPPEGCSGGDNWTSVDGGGFNITASGCNGSAETAVDGNTGSYNINNLPYSSTPYTVEISQSPGWNNTCPLNGDYSLITTVTDDVNFYVTLQEDPWWQVDGGNVHANGGNVSSNIPAGVNLLPYLITGERGLVSYTDSYNVGEGSINQQVDSNWQAETIYDGLTTNYAYFDRILEDDPQERKDWLGEKPSEGNGVYLGNAVIQTSGGDWDVGDGEVYVILVPNDLTINNNINIDPGGFLAIISSGNITIENSVTNVEGVYIADGTISSGIGDVQLIGEGIFTGWTDIDLGRDLGLDNDTDPAERFIYRPDLVRNAYQYLLKPQISWAEVAP